VHSYSSFLLFIANR